MFHNYFCIIHVFTNLVILQFVNLTSEWTWHWELNDDQNVRNNLSNNNKACAHNEGDLWTDNCIRTELGEFCVCSRKLTRGRKRISIYNNVDRSGCSILFDFLESKKKTMPPLFLTWLKKLQLKLSSILLIWPYHWDFQVLGWIVRFIV